MDKQDDKKRVESGVGIFRRFVQRQVVENVSSDVNSARTNSLGRFPLDAPLEGVSSNCGSNEDTLPCFSEYVRDDSSLLSIQPWIHKKDIFQVDGEVIKRNGSYSDRYSYDLGGAEFSPRRVAIHYELGRNGRVLRSRQPRRSSVRPVPSTENCLIPPLYGEHFEINDCVFSSAPLSTALLMRPFIITDGSRIIGQSHFDPSDNFDKKVNSIGVDAVGTVSGVPSLPQSRKSKRKGTELHSRKSEAFAPHESQKLPVSQVSPDAMLLFFIGISIGALYTIISHRKQVEKLTDLLKHTENFVQDLQEELEMKNSLTVKELSDEAFESQDIDENHANINQAIESFQNQVSRLQLFTQAAVSHGEPQSSKFMHKTQSLSNIEAELEAELEKLEINMCASGLDEIDPDLVAEVVRGDLREDSLGMEVEQSMVDPHSDSSSGNLTPMQDANYSVSPRELSLCLHKVIQSRLEDRIEELEQALHQSQKQVKFLESERAMSQTSFTNSYMGSSSNQASPVALEQDTTPSGPLFFNLSGDALDAYNEVYEEFMRIADDEDGAPRTATNMSEKDGVGGLHTNNCSLIWSMEGRDANNSSQKHILRSSGTNNTVWSERDDDDYIDDDGDELLIQQIVERTRKGSSVLMHAQRVLSADE